MAAFSVLVAIGAASLGLHVGGKLYLLVSISTFFVFFMLTDPRTSPVLPRHLIWFALVAALGSGLSVIFLPKSLFVGPLLLANLTAVGLNRLALRPKAAVLSKI